MKSLLGVDNIPDEEYDRLLCEQSQGKELKVIDGKVVSVDHEATQEEINEQRKFEISNRLNQLSQDFVQAQLGAEFEDMEERKAEFIKLHNELRALEGKEPRYYKTDKNSCNEQPINDIIETQGE